METQTAKKMEHEKGTRILQSFMGTTVSDKHPARTKIPAIDAEDLLCSLSLSLSVPPSLSLSLSVSLSLSLLKHKNPKPHTSPSSSTSPLGKEQAYR